MSNGFQVTLDTTAPFIRASLQKSTSSESILNVNIDTDDELEENQKLVFIDSLNNQHICELILSNDKRRGFCALELELFPLGVTRSKIQLKDEVWNLSNLVEIAFNVEFFKGNVIYTKVYCHTSSTMATTFYDNSEITIISQYDKTEINVSSEYNKSEMIIKSNHSKAELIAQIRR